MTEDTAQTGDRKTTTDHDMIREWVEQRGSTPAQGTEPAGDDPGSLTILPEGTINDSVREISWDEFFEIFEDEGLAFSHQTDKDDPDEQWFCEFTERGEAGTDTDASSTRESEERETINELEEGGASEAAAAGSGVAASSNKETTGEGSVEEVGDLDEPTELDEEPPEAVGTDEPTSPMEEIHEERTDKSDAEPVDRESVEGEPGMARDELGEAETVENEPVEGRMGETGPTGEDMRGTEPASDEIARSEGVDTDRDDEALGPGAVDEDEIVAGETTNRGMSDEGGVDEQTFGESDDEMRTEDDVATKEPVEGGPDGTGESEPAKPLESKVETTDTTEREPLESDIDIEEHEPMETSASVEGVDAEPIESKPSKPTEPGEPTRNEEIPTEREPPESEPTEPVEADIGGEPIDSGSMEGETDVGGEPIEAEPEPRETNADSEIEEPVESNSGIDRSSVRESSAETGAVDLTAEDEGKDVVNKDGEQIGIVSDVRGETLYVNPKWGLTEKISSKLGWDDADADIYPIEADQINTITDDEVEVARL